MHRITAADVGCWIRLPGFEHHRHIRIELIREEDVFLAGDLAQAVRHCAQRRVADILVWIRASVLDGLRRDQRNPCIVSLEQGHQLRLLVDVVFVNTLIVRPVAVVVHPEVDGDKGGLERQQVPGGTLQSAFRGVAAPADVAEGQLPLRETRESVGFDGGGIEALVGDAVAEKHHPLAIVNGELSSRAEAGYGGEGSEDDGEESQGGCFHAHCSCRCFCRFGGRPTV